MAASAKRSPRKRSKKANRKKRSSPQTAAPANPSSVQPHGAEQAGAQPFDPAWNDRIIAILTEAIQKHQAGDIADAEKMYRDALEIDSDHPHALHFLGVVHHQKGENEQAVRLIERSFARNPDFADAHSNMGAALFALERLPEAVEKFRRAIELDPLMADAHSNLAAILKEQGKIKAAIESYRAAHNASPASPKIIKRLADLYLAHDQFDDAVDWFSRYLSLAPDDAEVLSNLGYAHECQQNIDLAESCYRRAVELRPDSPEINNNIAGVLNRLGRVDEATEFYDRALNIAPEKWEDLASLARTHTNRRHIDQALPLFEKLLEARPDDVELLNDYGVSLSLAGQLEEGKKIFERVIELKPDFAAAYNSLGTNRYEARQLKPAIEAYKQSLKYEPQGADCLNNICFPLVLERRYDEAYLYAKAAASLRDYHPTKFTNPLKVFNALCDFDAAEEVSEVWENLPHLPTDTVAKCALVLLQYSDSDSKVERLVDAHRRWGEEFSKRAAQYPLPPLPKRKSGSKIRLGFITSDLRTHSVGVAMKPLLEAYDRDRFEIYCYAPYEILTDSQQLKFKEQVTSFKVFSNPSHRDLAEFIRKDEVDILFELNGFTLHNRMGALAYRAAPVQIFWLGYPFTIGLPEIDYILLDEYTKPRNENTLCEKVLLIPESWVTFGELNAIPIDPELPFERNGMITFGSQNNPNKITRPMVALWCEIMNQVPDSRFLLVRPECSSLSLVANLTKEFEQNGIGPDRVYFVNNRGQGLTHLTYYDEMDITLDTYPVTGGNTTVDAMWMGAPIISLVGNSLNQRLSYSLMNHVGIGDLCAHTREEYVEKAVALANDPDRLRELRFGLRRQFLESPLGQTERFAENFQNVMEQVARKHGLI